MANFNLPSNSKLVNYVRKELTTYTAYTGVTPIPNDNTIPQSNEGVNWLSSDSYTPKSPLNTIVAVARCYCGETSNTSDYALQALFKDSATDSFSSSMEASWAIVGSPVPSIETKGKFIAGSITPFVINARVSLNGGTTIEINGSAGTRKLGGVITSFIEIYEYLP